MADSRDPLLAPIPDAVHRDVAGVQLDIVKAGSGRVKRTVYPAGFRWSAGMKHEVGTELCMHAHVGFLARGAIGVRFADGCTQRYSAPAVIVIEPGHEGWVDGDEPAVLIEFDFEAETAARFGMIGAHQH